MALKLISRKQAESSPNYSIKKEVLIHEALTHPNVIRLLEARKDADYYYLVMEWATGGELFEKIEPDVGFPEDVAHMYFLQLLSVLKYFREQGVAHRDIKPENMLVDGQGNLKLTDFGLATVFKQHGQRRKLQTSCGTAMYIAPEILEGGGYEGDQVDLWSAAVVLFVMLAGCHPWEEPTSRCGHYDCFLKSRCHSYAPWNRFDPDLKALLIGLLKHNPADRLTLDEFWDNPWIKRTNPLVGPDGLCADPGRLNELLNESHASTDFTSGDESIPALTQLEISAIFSQAAHMRSLMGFSQPVTSSKEAGSSPFSSSSSPAEADQILHIQRLARFYSRSPSPQIISRLERQLNTMLVQNKVPPDSSRIVFATVDRRKGPLTGEINVHSLNDDLRLVLFTKAKGDSLEFKRFFKFVIRDLKDIIIPQ